MRTLLTFDQAAYALADTTKTIKMLTERNRNPLPVMTDGDKSVVDLRALLEWRQAETERLFRITDD